MKKKHKGLFITFEGAEGSGKSTQIKRAAELLKKNGHDVVLFREPGGSRISEAIREIILNKEFTEMFMHTELLLYLASRAQIVRECIWPELEKGKTVICDRFEDSTVAYQGYGRGIDLKTIEKVSRWLVRCELKPDLTFLLDIDPVKGMKRGGRHDRMEKQSMAFHHKVRQGFLDIARKNKKRCVIIDSSKPLGQVTQEIHEVLKKRVI